jgi:hypothetical protein
MRYVTYKDKPPAPRTRLDRMEEASCLGDALGIDEPESCGASNQLPERTRPDPGWRWYRGQSCFFGDPEWPHSRPER